MLQFSTVVLDCYLLSSVVRVLKLKFMMQWTSYEYIYPCNVHIISLSSSITQLCLRLLIFYYGIRLVAQKLICLTLCSLLANEILTNQLDSINNLKHNWLVCGLELLASFCRICEPIKRTCILSYLRATLHV
jgi:hypothetical protein